MSARYNHEHTTNTHSIERTRAAAVGVICATAVSIGLAVALVPSTAGAAEPISFQGQVFPIIKNNCLTSHQRGGEGYEASGLSMETYDDVMKGTKFDPIIVPVSALTSNFNVLVEGRADPSIQMPFHGTPLRPLQLRVLRQWVDEGAKNN